MSLQRWSFDEYGYDGKGCMYHPKPGCVHISDDDSAKFIGSLLKRKKPGGLPDYSRHAPALDIDYPTVIEATSEGTRIEIKGPKTERKYLYTLLDALVASGLMDGAVAKSLCTDADPEECMDLPALALKVEAQLHPSSTVGHFHLYLEKEMTWTTYDRLLYALYITGIIEQNFYNMCLQWRCSFLLKPGLKKIDLKVTFDAP